MSDPIYLALIAAVVAMFSAPLTAWLTNRNAAAKEKRDYARQDAVAAKAEEAAKLLLARQAEVKEATELAARLLKENQRTVAETAAATQRELKILTGMMDGNFTELMRDKVKAMARSLVLSRQVAALTHNAGFEPTSESLAEISTAETQIAELTKVIEDRDRGHTEMAHAAGPIPVTDDRTAAAAERSATAIERIAAATEDKSNPTKP